MNVPNQKQRSVMVHDYSMNPRSDVPRSVFPIDHGVKIPFNFSDLVPILIEEVLPGDTWKARVDIAARTAVPIVPLQDNWKLDFLSWFIPMRLVWDNAAKFWGQQTNPGDSINFTIPQLNVVASQPVGSLHDFFGIPVAGQLTNPMTVNALPFRCYHLCYNEWCRDENLQVSYLVPKGDGPDANGTYGLLQRGKRFDLITQALPWPQKGNTAVSLPLGSTAVVKTQAASGFTSGAVGIQWRDATTNAAPGVNNMMMVTNAVSSNPNMKVANTAAVATGGDFLYPSNLIADLTTATAATINQLRTAITLQQYLEKDARGGTRYTEFVFNHFGVRSPDARLQRPEFIGGGSIDILTTAIPQTSATGLTGATTPIGTLAATGHAHGTAGFTYSSTEHGYILTVVSARADLTYQQGLRRMWSRSTRYDYPVPLLANLGEQAIYNREIFCDGSANDALAFGYIPRWDEYRSIPSRIAGLYRSTAAGTLDYWHTSQKFTTAPALNSAFITDDTKTVVQRNFSAGASTLNQQILADVYWSGTVTRALPAYGVPGLTRL